jgi:hypothetical protein
MTLRSKETGGDVEFADDGTFPPLGAGNMVIRGGGIPARPDKTRIEISPGAVINATSTLIIAVCTFGILTGAGVILPGYSWGCIGLLIGVVNPMGRPKRP